ncbi:MAG: YibE/F family protein [Brockia lithotrophica]|nr:YibE/F family protein [Brockia lithotrophica]
MEVRNFSSAFSSPPAALPSTRLNLDAIATEIVRVLTGSIGLVAAIPLTAFFAALLATRERLRLP